MLPKFRGETRAQQTGIMFRVEVKDCRNVETKNHEEMTASLHYSVVAAKFMARLGSKPVEQIKKVEYISNPQLESRFEQVRKSDGSTGQVVMGWHGTHESNIESIIQNGFQAKKFGSAVGQKFGRGVYLSEHADVSLEYCQKGKKILLCRAAIEPSKTREVKPHHGRCWALVIEDVTRIVPCYVVEFM